jgi:hypothetical protein
MCQVLAQAFMWRGKRGFSGSSQTEWTLRALTSTQTLLTFYVHNVGMLLPLATTKDYYDCSRLK